MTDAIANKEQTSKEATDIFLKDVQNRCSQFAVSYISKEYKLLLSNLAEPRAIELLGIWSLYTAPRIQTKNFDPLGF